MSHLLPAKHFIDRKDIFKTHQLLVLRTHLIIDEVRQQHVHATGLLQLFHFCHNADQGLCIDPVIAVHDFIVAAGRIA